MKAITPLVFLVILIGLLYGIGAPPLAPIAVAAPPMSGGELTISRVSESVSGEQGNGISRSGRVSDDGAWVAFASNSDNLTSADQSPVNDIFLHERATDEILIISSGVDGEAQDGSSFSPRVSADGGFVVWESIADNMVLSDTNQVRDVFLRSRNDTPTQRLSVNAGDVEGDAPSNAPDISANGQMAVFESAASNLVVSDTNALTDVFVIDLVSQMMRRVSLAPDDSQGNGGAGEARISGDGRYIVFTSAATNLGEADTNGVADVFRYDLLTDEMVRISTTPQGVEANGASRGAALSDNGRVVVFTSEASNLVAGDTNGVADVFVRDILTGTILRVSQTATTEGDLPSGAADISGRGEYVVFSSQATTLVPDDTNGVADIFRVTLATGAVVRVSLTDTGAEADGNSLAPSISADGHVIAFESVAMNLVEGDTNGLPDVFVVAVVPSVERQMFLPTIMGRVGN